MITRILVSKLMFTVFTFFHLQIICQFLELFIFFFLSEIEKISMNIQKIQDGNAFANNCSIFAILSLMFIVEFLLAEYFLGRQREHQYKLQ